ncbi:MAG: TIGR00730 family Rossman fold protein [Candidatus Pacebacteria bacterium]|nr:TIGR00730 family Rossman fold protein [Candidatus Paceibacterota bacterium]MBP9780598.1 TIGR00730 family Rossman fold protein [Candidatus Paceibacterota bacterium]
MNTIHNGHTHLTPEEIKAGCINRVGNDKGKTRICVINEEFKQGFDFLQSKKKSITFFGSARFDENNKFYVQTRSLSGRISKELGFAVVSGGGPGIMEAANRGAFEAGGDSLGLTIDLPMEQYVNPYVTDSIPFYFFFARKVTLSYAAEGYIFAPGGFGTLDEFFEIITLVQTGKIPRIPIFCIGSEFWNPLQDFIKNVLITQKTIDEKDLEIYKITDNEDEIIEALRNVPIRQG